MEGLDIGSGWDLAAYESSGLNVSLKDAEAVTFINFLDAGTQTMTLQETLPDGTGDQNLVIIDTVYAKPKGGGAWTKITQTALATYDHSTDATNDVIAITVKASQLSDGFQNVEMTAGTGTCVAILHGLHVQRAPENMPNPIVA
jgi:hypothetical protein